MPRKDFVAAVRSNRAMNFQSDLELLEFVLLGPVGQVCQSFTLRQHSLEKFLVGGS